MIRFKVADLEPLGVLRGHGVYDAGEGFIGSKEAMAAGEQIAFKPAFAHMLGEHGVHDAAVSGQMIVCIIVLGVPCAVLHLEHRVEAVGIGLIRAEYAEVVGVGVEGKDIPYELAQLRHILAFPFAVL